MSTLPSPEPVPLEAFSQALRLPASRIVFDAGAEIFREGESGDVAYLIQEGYVRISAAEGTDKSMVALLGPGEIFGEMAPIEGETRSGTATAVHRTELFPITRDQLDSVICDTNPLVQLLLRSALRRLRGTDPGEASVASTHSFQSIRDEAATHIQRRSRLHDAIRTGELELYYQPIVSLVDGRTGGYEALVRWPQSDGSVVAPAEFIPLAESTGLIVELGAWVLSAALNALSRMHRRMERARLRASPIFMSINVSPRQLRRKEDLERLVHIIEEAEVDRSRVKIEITESTLLADPDAAAAGLARLKSTGVRIALDDFGVGYSSLSYLNRFPIDDLKIDRSFVNAITRDQGGRRVASAILSLARALEMDVVAEGVEQREEFLWLQSQQCQYGQGYLMGKPAPFGTAVGYLGRSFEW